MIEKSIELARHVQRRAIQGNRSKGAAGGAIVRVLVAQRQPIEGDAEHLRNQTVTNTAKAAKKAAALMRRATRKERNQAEALRREEQTEAVSS